MAAEPGRAGASAERVTAGTLSFAYTLSPAWMAPALQNSGAADLLRTISEGVMFGWLKALRRERIEKRSAASGFTAEIIAAREAYVSGRRGIAELTATAQSCVSLWEGAFALADVSGTDLLDRRSLALTARSVALRGEAVFLIRDRLVPCSDWDLRTRDGIPTAYRVSVPEAGGGRTETALAGEVLHLRIGGDPAAPYYGTAPLKRASLTAGLLNAIESALAETFEYGPLGSAIVPFPVTGN